MRFLGVGDSCDLGALYLRLVEDGHEVKVSIAEPLARGTLAGLVPQTPDWRAELDWIRAAGDQGIVLFENVADGRGALQDRLRRDGLQVIGGSDRSRRFFGRTLARMAPLLAEHAHVGYVNLNTIVNERGIWPLEFCGRFGYPGFAILDPLQETSWAELFRIMALRSAPGFKTRPGFSVGIVLTTPPFPYTRKDVAEAAGLPVLFEGPLDDEDRANLHYGEVGLEGGELVTSGLYGWTMVVTGVGPSIAAAKAKAYRLAGRVFAPNLRYRQDIGDKLAAGDYARLEALGMLGDEAALRPA
jgi:hypothetical protein